MKLPHNGGCHHYEHAGRYHCARIESVTRFDDANTIALVKDRWEDSFREAHYTFPMRVTVWTFGVNETHRAAHRRVVLVGIAHAANSVSMAPRHVDASLRSWVRRMVADAIKRSGIEAPR